MVINYIENKYAGQVMLVKLLQFNRRIEDNRYKGAIWPSCIRPQLRNYRYCFSVKFDTVLEIDIKYVSSHT